MVTQPVPRSKGECPDCGSRLRQNRSTTTLTCEKCEWDNIKQGDDFKEALEEDCERRRKQKAENFKERMKRKGNIKPKSYYE